MNWPGLSEPAATPWTGLVLAGVLLVGAYTDLRWRRLPNWLTLGGALLGLALNLTLRGPGAGLNSLVGWVVGCALLFLPFALGGMGAGDVKFLGTVGALMGSAFVLSAAVYMAFAGGALAIIVLLRRGTLLAFGRTLLGNLWFTARHLVFFRRPPPLASLGLEVGARPEEAFANPASGAKAFTLPYGVPIAIGALLRLALGH